MTICLAFLFFFAKADITTSLDSAKNFYTKGDFYEAQLIYQRLADDNYSSVELYYNLGNCYFRGEQFAPAIYYYEKALQIDPRHEKALANLKIANSRIPDKINRMEPVFYIIWYNALQQMLSSNGWAYAGLGSLMITVVFAIVYLLSGKRSIKILGFSMAVIFLITTAAAIFFSIKQKQAAENPKTAIVFEDVMIKSSPSNEGNNLFEIHEGLKVSITDTLNNWSEIKLPDGKHGWATSASLKRL
ncbi:MAG TPA: tetratricopeptide repeat protein [Bacteroidales bacterium]|nr:tetratricopeptide repeat protein [Bacteroidales bacterium]